MTASQAHAPAAAEARATEAQHALRVLHLDQAIRRWLGLEASQSAEFRLLGAQVSRWLRTAEHGPLFARLPALVAELQGTLPAARGRSAGDFDKAFAAALTQQAFAEVAREAGRSGRADAFVCLKPYLQEDPSGAEREQLAQALELSPPAIELALASLRRRLRGRVEAALDLWSDGAESRDTLRRNMRAALTEGTP
jgi:hypothetical protein